MIKIVLIVLGVLFIGLGGLLAYLGAFRSVTISESEEGPFYFVYREMKGNDPRMVGEITTSLDAELRSAGVAESRPFDIFQPSEANLPNEIGFVVSESDFARVEAERHAALKRVIARQKYMRTTFPFRNRLSFLVGFVKVDPALKAHRSTKGYAAAPAIARNDGDTITYLQPIAAAAPR